MNYLSKLFIFSFLLMLSTILTAQTGAIRINQVGYYPDANKIALVVFTNATNFEVINTLDSTVAFSGNLSAKMYWKDSGDSIRQADFSALTAEGNYKIRIPGFGESYPFTVSKTALRKAAYASLKSFYYQRSSYELKAPYAGLWSRPAGHPDTQCILHASTGKSGKISSPGGWYDAGDYGKYVINAGISVATMLSFYENFSNFFADSTIMIPESGNGQNDLLDEVKFELDWLKTMQDTDGGVFFKLTTLNFSGMVMPAADVASRYAIGKTTASALDFAAMMAMAGRIYSEYDSVYAADCVTRAESAWAWAKANPTIYFKNPADVSTGEYGDGNVTDEFIWAAAELYITTQKAEFKTYLESKSSLLRYNNAPGWPGVQPLASLSLATRTNGLSASLLITIKNSIVSTSDGWLNQIKANAARIPQYGFNWGSNSSLANMGVGMLYAYILTKDSKYIKGAAECADYLLGKNATGFSFVTGYGKKTPMNIHHRPSSADGIAQPVPGFVSGGPNSGKEDGEKYPFSNPAKSFVDVVGSYASNEICINWNSPMTALFAGVDAVLGDSSDVRLEVQTAVNNPPAVTISSPGYNASIGSDTPLKIKGSATDADGISKIEFYADARFIGTVTSGPFDFAVDSLKYGTHTVTVLAFDKHGLTTEKTNIFNYYAVNSIPGKVEAENFSAMKGVSTQTTSDTGGGLNVTGIDATEYIDYSLNIQQAGTYLVEYRVASSAGGGKLELRKISQAVLSSVSIVSTGGSQKWTTVTDTINLPAGKLTLRVLCVTPQWNINWLNFTYLNPTAIGDFSMGDNGNSIRVFPNPVKDGFSLKYNLSEVSPVDFSLCDIKGNLIETQNLSGIQANSGEFVWQLKSSLAPGMYIVNMHSNGKKLADCKLVKE